MSKKPFRRIIAVTAIFTLAFPLAACSSEKELTLEVCQDKQKKQSYKDADERKECKKILKKEERRLKAEREKEKEEKAKKAEEERLAKLKKIQDNVVIENFKADFERGAYVVSMDITNRNDSAVGPVTVTIPYGELYKDNYGDTQVAPRENTKTFDVIPASSSKSVRLIFNDEYAREKLAPIDGSKVTVETEGETTADTTKNNGAQMSQFIVEFTPDGYHFNAKVTNNTDHKIKSVTFSGLEVDDEGNYPCSYSYGLCNPTGSLTVEYIKESGGSKEVRTSYQLIDMEITSIEFEE